jgi:uncharacterized protein YcgL (UPF0745 family)
MKTCNIFRSEKKEETYLYLEENLEFSDLPDDFRQTFGEPAFVMRLEFKPELKLARVDTRAVLDGLEENGYFLQLPPKLPIEEEISRCLS